MFSMDPPRDDISSPVVEQEREWKEFSAVQEEGFSWRFIVSFCDYEWL
jgi:hypothetical protein